MIKSVLKGLSSLDTFRPAVPGEFTKRAFIAGRMDLTAVEGLADLIHAETEQQRRLALLQMEGSLAKLYERWRENLIKVLYSQSFFSLKFIGLFFSVSRMLKHSSISAKKKILKKTCWKSVGKN